MKRSEMVLEIRSIVEDSLENWDLPSYATEYTASNILIIIEAMGMLPPHEDYDRMYTYDSRAGGHYDRVIFEWEKENEKK